MRAIKTFLIVVFLSLLLGVGSAIWTIERGGMQGDIQIGPWQANSQTGSASADMSTRAVIARTALLALNPAETIYFLANEDSAGRALTSACIYRVTGPDLPARWWSLTTYGPDYFLIDNEDHRYAWSKTDMKAAGKSSLGVALAPESAGDRYDNLPILVNGKGEDEDVFSVLMRLYHPTRDAAEDTANITMPTIHREVCA